MMHAGLEERVEIVEGNNGKADILPAAPLGFRHSLNTGDGMTSGE